MGKSEELLVFFAASCFCGFVGRHGQASTDKGTLSVAPKDRVFVIRGHGQAPLVRGEKEHGQSSFVRGTGRIEPRRGVI